MAIEVQEPAPITLPVDVKELLIVNNTVKQPNDVGIIRTYQGKDVEGYELNLDSISWTTAISLLSCIKDAGFFEGVFLYNESLREDDDWITTAPLTEEFRNEIFNIQGFNCIVSIDRILYNLTKFANNNRAKQYSDELSVYIDAKSEVILTCSIYLNEREKPLTTFTVSDSLFIRQSIIEEPLVVFKKIPESLFYDLAYSIGEKLAYSIIPSWTTTTRIIYVGNKARMQEAFSYSKNDKWDMAESIWLSRYDKKSKESDKGKIANNIALANEMQDKFKEALSWAEKAKEHFQNSNLLKDSKECTSINEYILELQKRIHNNQMLDLQLLGTKDQI